MQSRLPQPPRLVSWFVVMSDLLSEPQDSRLEGVAKIVGQGNP